MIGFYCASHLRAVAPLLKEERALLNRAIGELGAIGRNLNQIARAINPKEWKMAMYQFAVLYGDRFTNPKN